MVAARRMPVGDVVTKALLLKLLLASLSGLSVSYEFGYHPSAEEFDSLLRETRTWTRDLLANDRRRAWQKTATAPAAAAATSEPKPATYLERFAPRYNAQHKSTPFRPPVRRWSPHVPLHVVATADDVPTSNLNFQMFTDELPTAGSEPTTAAPVLMHVQSGVIEVSESHKERPIKASAKPQEPNASAANFPVFFTNPATGRVYAITELGSANASDASIFSHNDSIPIYITKAQYDSDMEALRQRYASKCPRPNWASPTSVPAHNAADSTTARPQVVRLHKPTPTTSVLKRPISKLPPKAYVNHNKRPPVRVQAAFTAADQLPPGKRKPPQAMTANETKRKRKKKKKKKKNKNPSVKRPGHKLSTAAPPVHIAQPQIVLGTRIASSTTKRPLHLGLHTQVEKPHVPTMTSTVFSQSPLVASRKYINIAAKQATSAETEAQRHQRSIRRRRSTDQTAFQSEHTGAARKVSTSRRRKQKRPRSDTTKSRTGGTGAGNHTLLLPHAVHLLHRRNRTDANHAAQTKPAADAVASATATSSPDITGSALGLARPRNVARRETKSKSRRKNQRKDSSGGSDFDLFDFVNAGLGGNDDDDDAYEADDDDEGNDYNDSFYYDDNEQDKRHKPTVRIKKYADDNKDGLKEEIADDNNSSSAEEDADYGAMEEVELADVQQQLAPTKDSDNAAATEEATDDPVLGVSHTKHNMGNKRIRRRPQATTDSSSALWSDSDENYDDDDDYEAGIPNGVGSFFRMIFYPVQVVMTRIFDGFDGSPANEDEGAPNTANYPTYTLYNSANMQGSKEVTAENDGDGEEDDDANSFGAWLGSWFGLSRKTKKISSATVAPLTAPPPTEEPGWFESWFGFGKASEIEDDSEDKWFFGWFDNKPKSKGRRRTTTTTTTTTPIPQVPILTIVDPLRNPQNWINILAHHIANATSSSTSTTTTHNPLLEALTRVTSTTTENPDLPRRINYEKYQIWRLKPQDEIQVRALEEFKKSEDGMKLQWLKGPSLRGLTDVLVPPKMLIDFQGTLNFEAIAHEVLIFDVGKAISYEQSKEEYLNTTPLTPAKQPAKQRPAVGMTWSRYYEYDDIIKYLEMLRMRHSQLVELIHIGRSYEGRPLVVVKIESKQSATATAAAESHRKKLKYKRKSGQANAVFVEAGAHGLAWIGPAVATWIISELLRYMRTNKTDPDTDFIRNTTWYIMPVLNPDGYVYSHEYDRFWKKSRSRHIAKTNGGLLNSAMTWLQQKKSNEKICYGVDLDRNWQYHWGKRGSSKSPCNEFFAGPVPFSEPETKALSEFLMDYRTQIKLYTSLQAYGQVISYPVKANSTFNTERMDDFLDVAMVGTDGLRKKGSKSRYKVDSSNDLIEHRSGCSDAFAAYEIGIPFSYTLQLADNGVHGYLLPSSAIEATARDALEIITGMLDYI